MLLLFHSTLFEICVDFLLLAYRMKGNKAEKIKEDGRELEQGIHSCHERRAQDYVSGEGREDEI